MTPDPSCSSVCKGYEWTRILMETLRMGWKGLNTYSAEVALKRKMAFPLFRTMKVWWGDREDPTWLKT